MDKFKKSIEHSIQKRLIALEQAKMLFSDVEDIDALTRAQIFNPDTGRSKLVHLPVFSVIAAIDSGIKQTKEELKEHYRS